MVIDNDSMLDQDENTVHQVELNTDVVRNLYGSNIKSAIGHMFSIPLLVAFIIIYTEIELVSRTSLIISAMSMLLAYSVRYALVILYHTQGAQTRQPDAWLKSFRIATACCGLSWGLLGVVFFIPDNTTSQAFLMLSIIGVAAGAVISYAFDVTTLRIFMYTVVLPPLPQFAFSEGVTREMGALLLIFLIFVTISGKRLTRIMSENITLRIIANKGKESIIALAQRQKLHIEHTPMGVIELDENSRVTSWNAAAERIFGYSADEALNQNINFIIPSADQLEIGKIVHDLILGSGGEHSRNRNIRKDGIIIECEWFNTTLRDSNNKPIGIASLVQDVTAHIKAQEEVQRLAYYDPLTNLPNRRLLVDRLNQVIANSLQGDFYGAAMFIDLDDFKTLNDSKGHAIGDLLLEEVAKRLQSVLRANDTVARIGGDEFVILLESQGKELSQAITASSMIAEKLIEKINHPFNLNHYEHHNSCSLGICLFYGQEYSVEDILKQADTAMYQAKNAGRNNFKFFDSSTKPALDYRASLKNDLHVALAQGQFTLFFQNQVDHNHQVYGAEILLRWIHPERGMIPPLEFIPLAEESGLIVFIGTWVLEQACRQLKIWESSPSTRDLRLSVNVSALQFGQSDFARQVESALTASQCNEKLLLLELTESLVVQNIDDVINKMHTLKKMGVSLSMDDFGMGYSSLSVLKKLPLDELKIDKSFVQDALESIDNAVIVQTIVAMGKSLGLQVIAEGVETTEQVNFLSKAGCKAYQGYLFGKPIDVQSFESNLDKQQKRIVEAVGTFGSSFF